MIKEINDSILNATEDIIGHGCNCVGAFNDGIAKFIAINFPESKEEYINICKEKKFKLGDVQLVHSKNKIIANCATQYNYGKYLGMDHQSIDKRYTAIKLCLTTIYTYAKENNLSVAIPRIGCGRARADWNIVKKIIENIFHDYPITIYFIPDKYSK